MKKTIHLSKAEYQVFERFLQYGDVKKADIVFVGMEEGLNHKESSEQIEKRLRWGNSEVRTPFIEFVNDVNTDEGFYINDLCLHNWEEEKMKDPSLQWEDYQEKAKVNSTMRFQSRIVYLIDRKFKDYKSAKYDKDNAGRMKKHMLNYLHGKESNSANIDFFPLPRQGNFPFIIEGLRYKNYNEFVQYCLTKNNSRVKIIKNLYKNFNMKVSIVYAGINNGKFKLYPFFRDLGFRFKQLDANFVHSSFRKTFVEISEISKKPVFLLGQRMREDGHKQWVILTAFFGLNDPDYGMLTYDNVDIIASWASLCLDDKIDLSEIPGEELDSDHSLEVADTETGEKIKRQSKLVDKNGTINFIRETNTEEIAIIKPGKRGITNAQMIPAIEESIIRQDQNSLLLLKQTYPKVFRGSLRYIKKKQQARLKQWGLVTDDDIL